MSLQLYKASAAKSSVIEKRACLQGFASHNRPVTQEPETFSRFELWVHPHVIDAIIVRCSQLESDQGSVLDIGRQSEAIHIEYELCGETYLFDVFEVYNYLVDNPDIRANPIKSWNRVCVAFNAGKVTDDFDRTLEPHHKTVEQYRRLNLEVDLRILRLDYKLSRKQVRDHIPCRKQRQREFGRGIWWMDHDHHHGPCEKDLDYPSFDPGLTRDSIGSIDSPDIMDLLDFKTLRSLRDLGTHSEAPRGETKAHERSHRHQRTSDHSKALVKVSKGETKDHGESHRHNFLRSEHWQGQKSRDHKESSTHSAINTDRHAPSSHPHCTSSTHYAPSSHRATSGTHTPSSRHDTSRKHDSTFDKSMARMSVKDDGHKSHRHHKPSSTALVRIPEGESDDTTPPRNEGHREHRRSRH